MLTFFIKVVKYFSKVTGDVMKKIINEYLHGFKAGTIKMFKEFFNKETNKKQRANMWTFSRLIISLLIPIFSLISIITASFPLFLASIGVTGFAAMTDFFDGRSAKKHNSFSEYGKTLDQIADKVFAIMVGINLTLFNPLFSISLLGEGIIAFINATYKLKYNNLDIKSTQIGRIKQWPLSITLISGFLSVLNPVFLNFTNILIYITFILQIITANSYLIQNNANVNKIKKNEMDRLINQLEIEENENELTKSIIYRNNLKKYNIERKTKYDDLINFKNEILYNNIEVNEKIKQKIKK